jgi:hypothetical protein
MAYGDSLSPVASDAFTSIGGDWEQGPGNFNPMSVTGGDAHPTSAGSQAAIRRITETFADDQYSQAISGGQTQGLSGVVVRMAAAGNACYIGTSRQFDSNWTLMEYNTSGPPTGFALIASNATNWALLVDGDMIRMEAEGTELRFGSDRTGTDFERINTTDATLTTGDVGIYGLGGVGTNNRFDSWEGGDIGGVAPEQGDFSAEVDFAASFGATASSLGSVTAGVQAAQTVSGLAAAQGSFSAAIDASEAMVRAMAAVAAFSAGASAGESVSGSAAAQASLSGGVEVDEVVAGAAAALASITESLQAGAAFSGRAQAIASIAEAISAGDTDAAAQATGALLEASISVDSQYQAVADAVAAIQAGLQAGETWAAVAAAEAGLTAGTVFGALFSGDTESSQTAALAAGTEAAAQFLGSVAAFGLLSAGATAADAFYASASISAAFTAGAQAGATFATVTGQEDSISAAIAVQSAFAAEVAAISSLSAGADIADAFSAIGTALAAVSFGVLLGATFEAQSSSDVSIVGASASVSLSSTVASVRVVQGMSATVRNLLAKKATIN